MHNRVNKIYSKQLRSYNPVGIYLLTIETPEKGVKSIKTELTIKTPERRQWRCSGVSIVNFEQISHLVLVFLLLTLRR